MEVGAHGRSSLEPFSLNLSFNPRQEQSSAKKLLTEIKALN